MASFKHKKDSNIELSQLMLPSHSNFRGKIHGGYILEIMDQVAFTCASKYSGAYCVPASVDTVNFRNPIEVGELVTLKASINYVGNTSMVVGIRVESENIRNGSKKHCNSSYFTMVAKDDDGNNVKIPGLILETDNDIRRFVKSIKRKEMDRKREEEFSDEDFSKAKYKSKLKDYNVEINS